MTSLTLRHRAGALEMGASAPLRSQGAETPHPLRSAPLHSGRSCAEWWDGGRCPRWLSSCTPPLRFGPAGDSHSPVRSLPEGLAPQDLAFDCLALFSPEISNSSLTTRIFAATLANSSVIDELRSVQSPVLPCRRNQGK